MAPTGLPILCLDFDGVVHDYKHGWKDGRIYGHLTAGFYDWALKAQEFFTLVIYSSRSKDDDGIEQMSAWLVKEIGQSVVRKGYRGADNRVTVDIGKVRFEFAHEKPPAFLTIDDRSLTFNGNWDDFDPQTMRQFKPWMETKR